MPVKARFIEPMLLLKTDAVPSDATRWTYQIKLDGFRAIAFTTSGFTAFRSRGVFCSFQVQQIAARRSGSLTSSLGARRASGGRWS